MWVGELEIANPPTRLADPGPGPDGRPYSEARVLIRFQSEPVGIMTVELGPSGIDVAAIRAEAAEAFAAEIDRIAAGSWSPASEPLPAISAELEAMDPAELPAISVVIGTRNRPDLIVECVERVLKQDY
ncbi:MAG: hypothetical protein ACR2QO_14415, partial [Acidimicrobiales bacterium]